MEHVQEQVDRALKWYSYGDAAVLNGLNWTEPVKTTSPAN